ncbi:MAG TPA: hypothetical protein DF613_13225 [Lachnospiraceae bacterium]|nr:hypothetical protein [Lachnospiraceae bacterium]
MAKKKTQPPLHSQIYSDIRDWIIENDIAANEILPSENSLCAKYDTTRRTVREALKRLEIDGIIYSQPKRGYFVKRPSLGNFTIENSDFIKNSTSEIRDTKIVTINDEIQQLLQVAPHKFAIVITRVYSRDGQIYGAELKYIPYKRGEPSIENEIHYAVFPDPVDEKTFSFQYHARISIHAVLPPEDVHLLLGCSKDEPLLLIKRLYVTQAEKPISYSEQYLLPSCGGLHGISGYVQNKR